MSLGSIDDIGAGEGAAAADSFEVQPLPGATFGGLVRLTGADGARATVAAAEADPEALPRALYESGGLLLMPGMEEITEEPELLVRLSRLFGPEVEDYRETLGPGNRTLFDIHDGFPEILLVTNLPPNNRQPMPRPDPPLTEDGSFPVQFPHRKGWHTDQSFRRPPPDISLFYAVIPTPKGQGQTLYADGTAAYETLPATLKARIQGLEAFHALPRTGRSEEAVRAGETPRPLLPHEESRRQPIVRIHPVTGKPALYLCESGQLDWIWGPIADMEPGPDGAGAELLYEIVTHLTQPQFTYTHDWDRGDLVIYDNRNLLHAPTWFDTVKHDRLMWRTTTMGNPGEEYAGERKSWIPDPDTDPADGPDGV